MKGLITKAIIVESEDHHEIRYSSEKVGCNRPVNTGERQKTNVWGTAVADI